MAEFKVHMNIVWLNICLKNYTRNRESTNIFSQHNFVMRFTIATSKSIVHNLQKNCYNCLGLAYLNDSGDNETCFCKIVI